MRKTVIEEQKIESVSQPPAFSPAEDHCGENSATDNN